MKQWRARSIALAAALALALTACAGDDGDTSDEAPSEAEPADEEAATDDQPDDAVEEDPVDDDAVEDDAEDAAAADGVARVGTADTELGDILVDGEGMTLYLFDVDDQGPSQCDDDCADNWPPLLTDGDPVVEGGADDALLGTVERQDGEVQVTYDDWPVYHFIGDQAPGDVAGQGVQDVWWVLEGSGEPVRDAPADAGEEDEEESDRAGY